MPATTHWVSDEVWAQLDPKAGRLSVRGRWALAAAALGTVALLALVYVLAASGVIRPRLDRGNVSGWQESSWSKRTHAFTVVLAIDNPGWTSVTVESITTPTRGMRVSGTETLPRTVDAGAGTALTVHVQVTDCSHPGKLELRARVPRWWGTATVRVTPHELPPLVANACGRR